MANQSRGILGAGLAGVAILGLPIVGILALVLLFVAISGDDNRDTTSASSCVVADRAGTGDAKSRTVNIPNGWTPLVTAAAKTAGLPVTVVAAQLNQESHWDEKATSPAGADGVAQFIPPTWAKYGNGGDVFSAEDAIPAYGRYMADLKKQVQPFAGGDADQLIRLTLAAYNAGPGAVQQAKGIPPFAETQTYVTRILDGAQGDYSLDCSAPDGAVAWNGDLGKGEWTIPLPNSTVTSGYGRRNVPGLPAWANVHEGVDFATGAGNKPGGKVIAPTGLRITAFNDPDGCVIAKATSTPKFGFAFCHLDSYAVKKGQVLKRGDIIGVEGNHAESVGGGVATHLHFEVYKPDAPEVVYPYQGYNLDPEPILKQKGAWPK